MSVSVCAVAASCASVRVSVEHEPPTMFCTPPPIAAASASPSAGSGSDAAGRSVHRGVAIEFRVAATLTARAAGAPLVLQSLQVRWDLGRVQSFLRRGATVVAERAGGVPPLGDAIAVPGFVESAAHDASNAPSSRKNNAGADAGAGAVWCGTIADAAWLSRLTASRAQGGVSSPAGAVAVSSATVVLRLIVAGHFVGVGEDAGSGGGASATQWMLMCPLPAALTDRTVGRVVVARRPRSTAVASEANGAARADDDHSDCDEDEDAGAPSLHIRSALLLHRAPGGDDPLQCRDTLIVSERDESVAGVPSFQCQYDLKRSTVQVGHAESEDALDIVIEFGTGAAASRGASSSSAFADSSWLSSIVQCMQSPWFAAAVLVAVLLYSVASALSRSG